jgi:signal transduction histidine kinase
VKCRDNAILLYIFWNFRFNTSPWHLEVITNFHYFPSVTTSVTAFRRFVVALSPTSDINRWFYFWFHTAITVNFVGINFKTCLHIKSFIRKNFLRRLAQIRERGIQSKLYQELLSPYDTKEETSTIDVSLETVAPILVVLAVGYVTGIFVLLIERCVHGNTVKHRPRVCVRRWREIEYWRQLYNQQQSQLR